MNSEISIEQAINIILRVDFQCFLEKVFQTLHPAGTFEKNWHLDLFAEAASVVESGRVRRLIVNVPPRFLKSLCFSVALPAWILGHNPSARVIVASYSKALSNKHSQDCRCIMKSDWYREAFPETVIEKGYDTISKFSTTARGFRLAVSVYSALTGEGADFIIVDDPQTPEQAMSKRIRKRVINWFQKTLMSRLDDKKKGAVIVVMQRLHREDLSGFLLKNGTWNHINLPARTDMAKDLKAGSRVISREAGHLLQPSRVGNVELEQIRREMGEYAFESQYQQNPPIIGSGLIKSEWLLRYDNIDLSSADSIYQSWDCAVKTSNENDYSVCTTWAAKDGICYLIDVYREKLEYPFLMQNVIRLARKYGASSVLIEDKASGQQLIQSLRANDSEEYDFAIIGIMPRYDKITRLMLCSPLFEQGRILVPESASWLNAWEEELAAFPDGKHDDQIDSMTQFILWKESVLKAKGGVTYATRSDMRGWRMSSL